MIDITPTTNIIEAMRKQGLPWSIILGELIDNAFDAGAKRISIEFDAKTLIVRDDGRGCDNPVVMVRPGARSDSPTTRLGRYGIGAKDAAISAADMISIRSVHEGVARSLDCNWRKIERSGSWQIDDPVVSEGGGPSGTTIVLSPLRSTSIRHSDLVEKIGFHYAPAIENGRQILFRRSKKDPGQTIAAFKMPPLDPQKTADIWIGDKHARVTMGIVPEDSAFTERGLVLAYDYRIIKKGETIGLGDDPTPGLFGWIDLGKGWELSKNKDNITSNLDLLGVEIARQFADIVALAVKRSESIQFEGVAAELNEILEELHGGGANSANPDTKARRRPTREKKGTVAPTRTDMRHLQAQDEQDGRTFRGRSGKAMKLAIGFDHFGPEGPVSRCTNNCVTLNKDIPAIKADSKDRVAIARHAVYAIATYQVYKNPDCPLYDDAGDYFARISKMAGYLLAKLNAKHLTIAKGAA